MAAQGPARSAGADAQAAVTVLYQVNAVGLIRLAVVMLGDRAAAKDVVQDAFAEGVGPIPRKLSSHETLRVVATATGKTVATATLPGYVTEIAASQGAFFAAVVRGSAATFFEIRLKHDGTATTVTELPIPPDTAPLEFMAASPNGSKLAYSTLVMHGASGDVQNLVVASTTADRRTRLEGAAAALGPVCRDGVSVHG